MMKAIIHAINDDNVPGLQHLLGSLNSYDVNQPNKVTVNNVKNVICLIHCYTLKFIVLKKGPDH